MSSARGITINEMKKRLGLGIRDTAVIQAIKHLDIQPMGTVPYGESKVHYVFSSADYPQIRDRVRWILKKRKANDANADTKNNR